MSIQSTCSLCQFDENCTFGYDPLTAVKPALDFSSDAIGCSNPDFSFFEKFGSYLHIHKERSLIFEQRSAWNSQCKCVGNCFQIHFNKSASSKIADVVDLQSDWNKEIV